MAVSHPAHFVTENWRDWPFQNVRKLLRSPTTNTARPRELTIEDGENRGETRTTMTYNGDGQRITRQTGSALTTFIWDGADYIQEKTS